VSESAVSAKRGWGSFGAKAAQSETPVRAAAKRRPPGRGSSGRKMRSDQFSGGGIGPVVGLVLFGKGGMLWVDSQEVTKFASIADRQY